MRRSAMGPAGRRHGACILPFHLSTFAPGVVRQFLQQLVEIDFLFSFLFQAAAESREIRR